MERLCRKKRFKEKEKLKCKPKLSFKKYTNKECMQKFYCNRDLAMEIGWAQLKVELSTKGSFPSRPASTRSSFLSPPQPLHSSLPSPPPLIDSLPNPPCRFNLMLLLTMCDWCFYDATTVNNAFVRWTSTHPINTIRVAYTRFATRAWTASSYHNHPTISVTVDFTRWAMTSANYSFIPYAFHKWNTLYLANKCWYTASHWASLLSPRNPPPPPLLCKSVEMGISFCAMQKKTVLRFRSTTFQQRMYSDKNALAHCAFVNNMKGYWQYAQ